MQYFESFPKLLYDAEGNGDYKVITDILRRFKARKSITEQIVLFDKYSVKDGEKPEDVSHRFYGSPDYHWVVLSINNISDRYYGWPLSNIDFENYIADKYTNPDATHHHEIAQSSGKTSSLDNSHLITVNSDVSGASAVSNRTYEDRINENKRLIKILKPRYLDEYVEEFKRLIQR